MGWLWIVLGLLLLLYRPRLSKFFDGDALVWSMPGQHLIRLRFRDEKTVLVDDRVCYLYVEPVPRDETYVPAIRLDTEMVYDVLHYRYVLEWMESPPRIVRVPNECETLVDVLNALLQALQ